MIPLTSKDQTMDGSFLIGARAVTTDTRFTGFDPAADTPLAPDFAAADASHVEQACLLADAAFDVFRDTAPEDRATFLETIANNIEGLGDALIVRAMQESGLPRGRLEGERGRTMGQLRQFATLLRAGRWTNVVIDPAQPERAPLPRPDLRQRRVGIGPVAVFGASNFPLAFSVAGGDTASALAAGCPVVAKGHPAHPGTSALVGRAIADAVAACGLPEGVFSLLQGPSNDLGAALVTDPRIAAVGFTGSRSGGLALVRLAQARPVPIPVYAEMSSINPVLLFPAALDARAEALGKAYVASLTMGSGQFCTNPGVVIAVKGDALDRFAAAATAALSAAEPQVMLTPGIHAAYDSGVATLTQAPAVEALARGTAPAGANRGQAALFRTTARDFLANAALGHEVFGAASIIVAADDVDQMRSVLAQVEGQLTITLHLDDADAALAAPLMPLIERKAGRILANGWPTGVEVSPAMVHGGPFPATSDVRTTSVGTTAIERYLRPVCYQDLPDSLLPAAVQGANPWHLPRLVDGTPE